MVPAYPWAQEQFLYYPTQLDPKMSEGSYQAFSLGHPFPNLSWLSFWARYFFLPKPVLEPVLCRRKDKTKHVPNFPLGDIQPLSHSFLSAGFSLHSYASPLSET